MMSHWKRNAFLWSCCLALVLAPAAFAQETPARPALHIDVPVDVKPSRVVFNMDHLAFAGDQPIGLKHMQILTQTYRERQTPLEVVAIFHSAAGYMVLNDEAYKRVRKSDIGNPYKAQIRALQEQGVQFEECVVTMKVNGWTNADLLPGVKVNAGANLRLIQLSQQGYVVLHP
ncbi:DsrE family protein [Rhodoblastus sp.]|uniref:DsrE family protein n=1 Tax=Rhodoblastus sp. TaxID=1962975 RepID=UPI00262162E8|nr:DsrE family protein [Rhodoblastus sp.]